MSVSAGCKATVFTDVDVTSTASVYPKFRYPQSTILPSLPFFPELRNSYQQGLYPYQACWAWQQLRKPGESHHHQICEYRPSCCLQQSFFYLPVKAGIKYGTVFRVKHTELIFPPYKPRSCQSEDCSWVFLKVGIKINKNKVFLLFAI
jgi:hypothetical protein